MSKFMFEYHYSDGEWMVTKYTSFDAETLFLACQEFEGTFFGEYNSYSVYEVGRQVI